LVGFFLNNLIPSGVGGDVYRVFALGSMGAGRVHAAASVVVERWSAFLALLVATALSYAAALPLLRGAEASSLLGELWPPLARLRLDWMMGVFLVLLTVAFLVSQFTATPLTLPICRRIRFEPAEHPDPEWTCPRCSETVDATLDACWNCDTPRPPS